MLVNVAKNIEETCPKDVLAGKVWPVTLKGEVATTTCLDGVGREVIKCNPVPGWPPTKWDSISSQVECVRHTFIQEFDRLRRYIQQAKPAESYFTLSLFRQVAYVKQCPRISQRAKSFLTPETFAYH